MYPRNTFPSEEEFRKLYLCEPSMIEKVEHEETEITIYACPRQVGKTTRLIQRSLEVENPFILTINTSVSKIIKEKISAISPRNIPVVSASKSFYNIARNSHVLVDEYDFFSDNGKKRLFEEINRNTPRKVEIYTSCKGPRFNVSLTPGSGERNPDLFHDGRSSVYSISINRDPNNIKLKEIFGERDFKIEILNQSINFKPIEWQQVK